MAMEETLSEEARERKWKLTRSGLKEEMKSVSYLAAPMMAVAVSQNSLQLVSIIMAGHFDKLSLSGVAIANSFTALTGFSLLFGMAGGLETLCGQAYGAEQYHKISLYTYSSIISLTLVCFPVSLLWIFVEKLLVLMGQDSLVSKEAGKYSIFLIPALFGYAILTSLIRYLQTQGLTLAMFTSSIAALCFHIPVCWALVYKSQLGALGAALSLGLSYWFSVVLLVLHVNFSNVCEKTRPRFTFQVILTVRELLRFALPSAGMACLELWAFEIVIFLSGTLRNSKLETSVLVIGYTTLIVHLFVSNGIGAAASNELGAGKPGEAQAAICAAVILAAVEAVTVAVALFCCRYILGYAYTNDKEVVDYVPKMTPFLSLSIVAGALKVVLSGLSPIFCP